MSRIRVLLSTLAALLVAGVAAATSFAQAVDAPPVGPLPAGPTTTVGVTRGESFAVSLPVRVGGRVWRIARPYDAQVVREISEGNVGSYVVVVFAARRRGTATIRFGLTRGERAKAFESRTISVRVR